MDVCDMPLESVFELKPFLEECKFLPYAEYNVSRDLSANLVLNEISDIISKKGLCLVAREQSNVIGLISLEKLDWDTNHFGFPIAKISHLMSAGDNHQSFNVKRKLISATLERCYANLQLHVFARVNKEDLISIHALESQSFHLMDVLVTYSFDFRKQQRHTQLGLFQVKPYRPEEIHQLSELAKTCFANTAIATDRFHADPTLPKEKSDLLYVKWLTDSSKNIHSEILVVERDGQPIGFNVCNIGLLLTKQFGFRLGTIALTAVRPSERGRLVATSLLEGSLAWFEGKVDVVETGGQVSNYAVQRAWVRTGFKITRSQCTYHWSPTPEIVQ
ncbi:MAG TPA: GNAT family N-acetyltransferase [Candidatus Binatia bacterium]|nr:GNAT family N-acetyltransferase [Candidatus Binatia bacterium]